MLVAVLSGFAASLAAPWVYRIGRGGAGWLLAALPFGLMIYFANCHRNIGLSSVRRADFQSTLGC